MQSFLLPPELSRIREEALASNPEPAFDARTLMHFV